MITVRPSLRLRPLIPLGFLVLLLALPGLSPRAFAQAKLDAEPEELNVADPDEIRGITFRRHLLSAIEPASKMAALARHCMKKEMDPATAKAYFERAMDSYPKRLNQTLTGTPAGRIAAADRPRARVFVPSLGIVRKDGQIVALTPDPHPDYENGYIARASDFNPRVVSVKMERRPNISSFYMKPRPNFPHQYEMLLLTNYEGRYQEHFIYYTIDLAATCREALAECPLQSNENFYLMRRSGDIIIQGLPNENRFLPRRQTRIEAANETAYRREFTEQAFGFDAYAGFSRGGPDFALTRYAWEHIYTGFNDSWILVFEERLPIARNPEALLRGTWSSTSAIPLRVGILQTPESPGQAIVRATCGKGTFSLSAGFINNRLVLSKLLSQSMSPGWTLAGFNGTLTEGDLIAPFDSPPAVLSTDPSAETTPKRNPDKLTIFLHWDRDGKRQVQSISMDRISDVNQLSPLRIPLATTVDE